MFTRREYLKLMAYAPLVLSAPTLGDEIKSNQIKSRLIELSEELLSEWCRGLLRHQLNRPESVLEHGGLWSLGDNRILGRCADAVYPFLWYAKKHQDDIYIEAATNLMNWSLNNMAHPDGSWQNEFKDKWNGITVFIAVAMAQSLFFYDDILPVKIKNQWLARLELTGQWLNKTIDINFGNINYPISNAYAMALLGRLLNNQEYTTRGKELAHSALNWFTQNDHFLYGEGRNNKIYPDNVTKRGCYPIDLGYNVEESLPMLTLYGLFENDERILNQVIKSLDTHLQFMLPDGSWDNSWGTRNYKWTWWGSRTTDGCQPAYALLANKNASFLEAAYRNTQLLRKCTLNGILQGGPHLNIRGLPASLHHTFCHAKGLATMLNIGIPNIYNIESLIPCEKNYGTRYFSDIATQVISHHPWRATITCYDFPDKRTNASHPSGGALSLLWHKNAGPLITASMTRFSKLEEFDMPNENGVGFGVLTPRVELKKRSNIYQDIINRWLNKNFIPKIYMNIMDFGATIDSTKQDDNILVKTVARLVDENQKSPIEKDITCSITYLFSGNSIEIEISVAFNDPEYELTYYIPIVSHHLELVSKETDNIVSINKCQNIIRVTSNHPLSLTESLQSRIFSHIPGHEAIPIKIPINTDILKIKVEVIEV